MNYIDKRRNELLSAEYVLQTLRGKARIRYLKLLLRYPVLRPSLWQWEAIFCHYIHTYPVKNINQSKKHNMFCKIRKQIKHQSLYSELH